MSSRKTDAERPDEENPEWTAEDMKNARPAAEVLPKYVGEKATLELLRRNRGRPPKEAKKVSTTVKLDPDVLEAYQQEGNGWQTRINAVLREHMPKRQKRRTARSARAPGRSTRV